MLEHYYSPLPALMLTTILLYRTPFLCGTHLLLIKSLLHLYFHLNATFNTLVVT